MYCNTLHWTALQCSVVPYGTRFKSSKPGRNSQTQQEGFQHWISSGPDKVSHCICLISDSSGWFTIMQLFWSRQFVPFYFSYFRIIRMVYSSRALIILAAIATGTHHYLAQLYILPPAHSSTYFSSFALASPLQIDPTLSHGPSYHHISFMCPSP